MEVVSSRKNPLVAEMRRAARAEPGARDRVLLEGLHLLEEARSAHVPIVCAAFSARVLAEPDGRARRLATSLAGVGVRVVQVPETVLEAMSPAQTPAGVVALGARPRHTLDGILSGAAVPLVSVLVDVQDPGNVGAIARVSEAAGATGLLACGSSADPFGWKALRGSMGSAFRLPIAQEADTAAAIAALRARGLQIVGTAPAAAIPFDRVEWRRPTAFLVGSEGAGLDAAAARAADVMAAIPMQPPVESLNVAVSAGLLAYEARRQRTAAGAGR